MQYMEKPRNQLLAEIAGALFAAQLTQIKLWEADEIDPKRLMNLCVRFADDILEASGCVDQEE